MIVSHKHKFIFIKNGKVGGTSFETRLSPFLGNQDVVTPFGVAAEDQLDEQDRLKHSGGIGPQNYEKPLLRWQLTDISRYLRGKKPLPLFYNHMSASECRSVLGEQIFDSYLKIGIIREPFDTSISLYFWSQPSERGPISKEGFEEWLLNNAFRLKDNWDKILINGEVCLDIAVPFENPVSELKNFKKRVGLPSAFLSNPPKRRAKSGFRPRWATVDFMFADFPEGVVAIQKSCVEQIDFFKHTVPGSN